MFIRLLLVISRCLLVGLLASLPAMSFAQVEEEEELINEESIESSSDEEEADAEDGADVPEYPILDAKELLNAKTYFSIQEAMANPQAVYKLSLRGQDLKELPAVVRSFPHLQWLDISNNKIKELPSWFGELNRIELLNLFDNRLTALPEDLSALSRLHTLYLGNNRLTAIPAWVGGIGQLRKLDVTGNGLTMYELSRLVAAIPKCEITY